MLRRAPATSSDDVRQAVAAILDRVRTQGDPELLKCCRQFDHSQRNAIWYTPAEIEDAARQVDPPLAEAIDKAAAMIKRFHTATRPLDQMIPMMTGLTCSVRYSPIASVGLYAPGGATPLPSTVLMLGVPAMLAGCPRTILASPPVDGTSIDPAVAYAAQRCEIDTILAAGGAHAVAAMAFGTESLSRVNKIFGPGSIWVTEAKRQVAAEGHGVTIDMPAGPSEVLVVADDSARAKFVAADMLAQLEHGSDSQAILVTTAPDLSNQVRDELQTRGAELERAEIVRDSLRHTRIIVVESLADAIEVANRYAAEHGIVQTRDAYAVASKITAAGSLFLGPWTPEVLGDYCSGTNHVLPTSGFARSLNGLSVTDFLKRITVQEAEPMALSALAPTARRLAVHEGLTAHAAAVAIRLETLEEPGNDAACDTQADNPLWREDLKGNATGATPPPAADSAVGEADRWTRLHCNENPWSPRGSQFSGINRYPAQQPAELRTRLAELYDVSAESLLVTRGADDGIDLLVRGLCQPASRERIAQASPTFSMYAWFARLHGIGVVEVPLQGDFRVDAPGFLDAVDRGCRLLFLCSPNNPTGTLVDAATVIDLCEKTAGRATVVVDEAYIEFSAAGSLVPRVSDYSNLVVLRTLSKAWGLANCRLGVVAAHPALIRFLLDCVMPPYPLSSVVATEALAALTPASIIESKERIQRLRATREAWTERLSCFPFVRHVVPSEANFLLAEVTDPDGLTNHCARHGIRIRHLGGRDRPGPGGTGLGHHVRISMGSDEEMERLEQALTTWEERI